MSNRFLGFIVSAARGNLTTTLIPRPESEALVEAVLAAVPADRALTIADIGTGSGNLAVAIAKYRPTATVYATDHSAAALRVARRNARRNLSAGYHDRDNQPIVHFRLGDLLRPLAGTHLDMVVTNLPYASNARCRGIVTLRVPPTADRDLP